MIFMRLEEIIFMKVKSQELLDIHLENKKELTQILKKNGSIIFIGIKMKIIKIMILRKKTILIKVIIVQIKMKVKRT